MKVRRRILLQLVSRGTGSVGVQRHGAGSTGRHDVHVLPRQVLARLHISVLPAVHLQPSSTPARFHTSRAHTFSTAVPLMQGTQIGSAVSHMQGTQVGSAASHMKGTQVGSAVPHMDDTQVGSAFFTHERHTGWISSITHGWHTQVGSAASHMDGIHKLDQRHHTCKEHRLDQRVFTHARNTGWICGITYARHQLEGV